MYQLTFTLYQNDYQLLLDKATELGIDFDFSDDFELDEDTGLMTLHFVPFYGTADNLLKLAKFDDELHGHGGPSFSEEETRELMEAV